MGKRTTRIYHHIEPAGADKLKELIQDYETVTEGVFRIIRGEKKNMNSRNSALRRYYRTIRSYLPCSGKLKKQILTEIQANVSGYLAEFPEAEFPQIETRFGTPQSIAAAYVDDMNTQELLGSLHIRRRILMVVLAGISIATLLWASAVFSATYSHYSAMTGHSESYIVDLSTEPTNQ